MKGATVAVVRGISSRADVIISAYEGATKIDSATGEPGGVSGAIEGALWSIGTNKAFEAVGARFQQAKAEYALARQAAGGLGFKPVVRASEAQITEFDFQTPEQRYKTELETAKTPEAQTAVNRKYAIQAEREVMGTEREAARQKAEEAIRKGSDPAAANEQYNRDLKAIDDKYAARETRNQEHQEVMKELGFDLTYDKNNVDILPTGSNPKTAASDMDFTPVGGTPHDAYQKGKAYVEAMKKRGHHIDEYGDRWVDTTNDATIWKPGFNVDQPGSSSLEAEAIFGSLPNSDKFATKGGIEWTSSETHVTADPLGAVLANAGKAAGAGLGNSRQLDLHVIGKSAVKAAEAAGIEVDLQLKAQIEALKAHQTPEQAGVVDLGAGQATKDKQVQSFLVKVQALMGRAYAKAKAESDKNARALEQKATAAGTTDQAYKMRSQLKAYQASDEAASATIAQVSPGLAGEMGRSASPADLLPSGPAASPNLGGLARTLAADRDSDAQAPPLPADSNDPAFGDLGERCKQAAKNVSAKLAAAKPGSDEARYLADLKTALEQGASHPAEAVRIVRGLTGTELPAVLAQLGVSAGVKSR